MRSGNLHTKHFLYGLFASWMCFSSASADVSSSQIAEFDVSSTGKVFLGTLSDTIANTIQLNAGGGVSYNNNITTTSIIPPLGWTIRTVLAVKVADLERTVGGNIDADLISNPGINPQSDLILEFAGEAQVTVSFDGLGNATLIADFGTNGNAALFELPADDFDPDDPTTWPDGTNPLATFELKQPEAVVPGVGKNIGPFPAEVINKIALNELNPNQSQGQFLFLDVLDPVWKVTNPVVPPGAVINGEGVHIDISQSAQTDPVVTDPIISALNAIAQNLGGFVDFGFATGIGNGAATEFDGVGQGFDTGDNALDTSILAHPTIEFQNDVVPEPASVLTWSFLAIGAFGFVLVRRRRAHKLTVA